MTNYDSHEWYDVDNNLEKCWRCGILHEVGEYRGLQYGLVNSVGSVIPVDECPMCDSETMKTD